MTERKRIESTADLRRFLLETMVRVSDGEVSLDRAEMVCALSQQVHNTLAAEIKVLQSLPASGLLSHRSEPSEPAKVALTT